MRSKRLIITALMAITLTGNAPVYSNDNVADPKVTSSNHAPSPEVQQMLLRLDEIRAMDTRNLSARERRALRKEVNEIDKKVQNGGYVTISVGALIIIILLLLLI